MRAGLALCVSTLLVLCGGAAMAATPSTPQDFVLAIQKAPATAHTPGLPYRLQVRNIRKWTATSVVACVGISPKAGKIVGVANGGVIRFGGSRACWILRRVKSGQAARLRFDVKPKRGTRGQAHIKLTAQASGGNSYAASRQPEVALGSPSRSPHSKHQGVRHHSSRHDAASSIAPCVPPQTLGIVFVTDDSGSMELSDPIDLRAQAIAVGLDQLPDGSLAGATAFSTTSRQLFGVAALSAATRPGLKSAATSLFDSGETEYHEAFAGARAELAQMPGADRKAVIFLSDGVPTDVGLFDPNAPVDVGGAPIYTIGLGVDGNSEATSILSHIAAGSGGQYYDASSAGQLQGIFARIVAPLTCGAESVAESFTLAPGASRSIPFAVEPEDGEFRALAAWSGQGVTVTAQRPDTTSMTPGTLNPGEAFVNESSYALLTGIDPAIGGWHLIVTANQGNVGDVGVTIDVFKKGLPAPPPLPPPVGRMLDPCVTAYPTTSQHSKKIFGGHEEVYDRAASLYQVCAGFGTPEGLDLSPEMKCALVAAAATFGGPPLSIRADQACNAISFANAYRSGDWVGAVGGTACGYFGQVFAGGVGIVAAGAASETGPGAVAVGLYTYRAMAAGLKVACGGLFDGGATALGTKLEADHETHLALDVTRRGKCIGYRERFDQISWRAIDCA